jgi:hypothetical protein
MAMHILKCETIEDFRRTRWDAPVKAEIRLEAGRFLAYLFDNYDNRALGRPKDAQWLDQNNAPSALGAAPAAMTGTFERKADLIAFLGEARIRRSNIYDFAPDKAEQTLKEMDMASVDAMPDQQLIHIARNAATATDLEQELAARLEAANKLIAMFDPDLVEHHRDLLEQTETPSVTPARTMQPMKAFPAVGHLSLEQSLVMLGHAEALVVEAGKPNDYEGGHMHDNLAYRMLRYAAASLRQEIAVTFNVSPETLAPEADTPRRGR